VTSQGNAYARLRRALASGSPTIAWAAAFEVPRIELDDALRLVLLLCDDERRYDPAAVRFLARLLGEGRVTLTQAQLVARALDAQPDAEQLRALAAICEQAGVPAVAAAALEAV
jgi:hypothetical protein